ncbi:unnamed protein product [Cyprideis torosa]|uniref:Uncharacterized protein n=1 Tax=Cyprideis torosa TaxID=163714 RepID=A0A7R8WUX6_9CRUS|nr:unnamed protein product [Cyprideis torosa]CAG0906090.1 unnamed protein product [Cyprideis torosa]
MDPEAAVGAPLAPSVWGGGAERAPLEGRGVLPFLRGTLPTEVTGKETEMLDSIRRGFSLTLGGSERPGRAARVRRRRKLNAREKASLGLRSVRQLRGLKYTDVLPLNSLWKGYASDALQLDRLKACPEEAMSQQMVVRLGKLDLHGCLLSVDRAKCSSYVGLEGLVVKVGPHPLTQ